MYSKRERENRYIRARIMRARIVCPRPTTAAHTQMQERSFRICVRVQRGGYIPYIRSGALYTRWTMGVDQRREREREREEGSELVMPCLRILAIILGDDADAAIAL